MTTTLRVKAMQVRSIREYRKRWLEYINYCQQGPKSLFQNGKGKRSDDSKLLSPAEIETFWTEVLGQLGGHAKQMT